MTRILIATVVTCVCLIAGVVYLGLQEQAEWDAFAAKHNCKVVEKVSGSSATVVTMTPTASGIRVGTGVATTPGKTGYACNDGVTYWR